MDRIKGLTESAEKIMKPLADKKSAAVKFTCTSCKEIYYARCLADMYVCPKCGAPQRE